MNPIRVFLVDDHCVVREGLLRMLEQEEDLLVLGEAQSGEEALARLQDSPADVVLLDVPCTNTGVLGRRPEARWNFSGRDLQRCLRTQRAILKAVLSKGLDQKTRLLWSTCSLEPEENQQMVEAAAARFGLEIRTSHLFEPSEMRSGGFAAVLSRGT